MEFSRSDVQGGQKSDHPLYLRSMYTTLFFLTQSNNTLKNVSAEPSPLSGCQLAHIPDPSILFESESDLVEVPESDLFDWGYRGALDAPSFRKNRGSTSQDTTAASQTESTTTSRSSASRVQGSVLPSPNMADRHLILPTTSLIKKQADLSAIHISRAVATSQNYTSKARRTKLGILSTIYSYYARSVTISQISVSAAVT